MTIDNKKVGLSLQARPTFDKHGKTLADKEGGSIT